MAQQDTTTNIPKPLAELGVIKATKLVSGLDYQYHLRFFDGDTLTYQHSMSDTVFATGEAMLADMIAQIRTQRALPFD